MTSFETILLDVNAESHVATITLNRPDLAQRVQPNPCARRWLEAWRIVKLDEVGERRGASVRPATGRSALVWTRPKPPTANRTTCGITRIRARR